jgi:hypothetical protein
LSRIPPSKPDPWVEGRRPSVRCYAEDCPNRAGGDGVGILNLIPEGQAVVRPVRVVLCPDHWRQVKTTGRIRLADHPDDRGPDMTLPEGVTL